MKNRISDVVKKFADRCDYLEVHVEETEESRVGFTGKRLSDIGRRVESGGNVRALHKGGWGFASFNSMDRLEEFAGHAVDQARLVGTDVSRLADVKPIVADVTLDVKNDPRDVSLADKVAILRTYNEQVLGFHDEIITSSLTYFDRYRRFWFGNSEGGMVYQERVDIGGRVTPVASRGDGSQSYSASFGGSDNFDVVRGLDDEIAEACRVALGKLDAPKVKAGEYTVVVDPRLGGVFVHEAFGHLSEGDNVYEDKNLQEVMVLGRRFGKPFLNVYDTGLDKGLRGYLVYDDEGVPTEKTYLIREGELVGRLHSRETAGKMGERPTGNARLIDYRHPPVPRMRNTVIDAGDSSFDEMIAGINLGIYCISASGGQTNGEMFTFTAANAYMIREGKLAEQVRDVMLTGNVFSTLENIDAIGNDLACHDGGGGCGKAGQFPLPVTHGSPHVRIRNVVIGGE
ncbi:TldD/PmbA family protein [bacterium]|nr:TldD/PmbA family protein [bacterium]